MSLRALVLCHSVVLLVGCGPAAPEVPTIADDMTCEEVVAALEEALDRGARFIAGEESDERLAADLVFALSGAEARPECVDEATRSRAAGMRATLGGIGG